MAKAKGEKLLAKTRLRDKEIKNIREAIYPFSEATPSGGDAERIIGDIQKKTAEAQLLKAIPLIRADEGQRIIKLIKKGYIPGEDMDTLIKDIERLKP